MKSKKLYLAIVGVLCAISICSCFIYKSYKNKNLKHIVLLGKPGCGKGTQAKYLAGKYNLYHVDGGQLLRNCVKDNCKYKDEIQQAFTTATLVRGEIVKYVVKKAFEDNLYCLTCRYKGAIIDGMPRNVETIEVFKENNIPFSAVIDLDVSDENSKNRVLGRNSGRSDDNLEVLARRLQSFREKTLPVFEYYKQQGLYKHVDVNGTLEEALAGTSKILDEIYKK